MSDSPVLDASGAPRPRILLVDDEQNVLDSLRRTLSMDYDVEVATSGFVALRILRDKGPFSVVVSDMQMPRMNGAWFLSRVRDHWPRTTRVLLTGHADLNAAIEAVNRGRVFEFLTKPCKDARLREVLTAAVEQQRVLEREANLIEETVANSIRLLCEVLEIVNPVAFGRAERLARIMETVSERLDLPEAWQCVTAARLSQLGCVGLPTELLAKIHIGQALDAGEEAAYRDHPRIGSSMIESIPRLEVVAKMVAGQLEVPEPGGESSSDPILALGTNLLRAALTFESRRLQGVPGSEVLEELRNQGFSSQILDAFRGISLVKDNGAIKIVQIADLNIYMQLAQDIRSTTGSMLAAKGQRVTRAMLARLLNFQKSQKLEGPVRVMMLPDEEGGRPVEGDSRGVVESSR